MKCLSITLILVFLPTVTHADDPKTKKAAEKPKVEVEDFQFDGIWKPKGAMLSGVLLPPPALKAITLKIEKGKYEVTAQGEEHEDKGTYTIDETVTPKRMTIKSTSGPNKGKTILAIYEIKGPDAMRVCYDLSGKEFPKEFKAPKGTETYLAGYRRQKATAAEDNQGDKEM